MSGLKEKCMSKLDDAYWAIRRNANEIVGRAFIVGMIGLFAGGMFSIHKMNKVYRGIIDGYSVAYDEGKFSASAAGWFYENRMTAQKEDIKYHFEDLKDETNIGWGKQQKPDFEKDNLEKVVITTGDVSKVYRSKWDGNLSTIDISTLQGQKAKKVFDEANSLYNNIRSKIREKLRTKYEAEQEPFVGSLQE